MLSPNEVVFLWFEGQFAPNSLWGDKVKQWFSCDRKVDRYIRKHLLAYTTLASEGVLDNWQNDAQGSLALVLLLDRISRASYRGTAMAYDNDLKARKTCLTAFEKGFDWKLKNTERIFLLFPLIASEKLEHQSFASSKLRDYESYTDEEENSLVSNLLDLIERNKLVLEKFSRFPHKAQAQGFALRQQERVFIADYEWQDWL